MLIGCTKNSNEVNSVKYETEKIVVDDAVIISNDDFKIIEPVWWSVSIYDGVKQYNKDLEKFSDPQRYVFAIEWYLSEVNNGGHDQFYFNSTGIVWEDAMKGFQEIGATENYNIIKESADMLGGKPNKDREKRQDELDKYEPDFSELDDRYYVSESAMIEMLHLYIKTNAKDYYFNGEVKIPK
jgi:hypothetical protein